MARLPLENIPLERSILGALIGSPDTLWRYKDRLRPDLFCHPLHVKILTGIHTLADSARDATIPAIISQITLDDRDDSNFSIEGYLATLMADEAEPDQLADNIGDLEGMWARREMAKLGGELIRQSTEDNGLDPISRLDAAREKVTAIGDPIGSNVKSALQIAQEVLDRVGAAMQTEQTLGLDLGLKAMQDLTGPLMPGRMYVLAGPPGSGKSALAWQVGSYISETTPVLFEEIEMQDVELIERDLASRTGIGADRIERAAVNPEEFDRIYEAAEKLGKKLMYVDSTSGPTMQTIRSKATRMKRLRGLGLLVIDHLLYIAPADRKKGEFENIRLNLQALKKLAKDLGVPVLLLTQLKKEFGEGKWQDMRRPGVSDLYGGSSVEQEADVVLFVHREEYLMRRKEPAQDAKDRADWEIKLNSVAGKAELVLAKRRGGKGFGIRTLSFHGPSVTFSD